MRFTNEWVEIVNPTEICPQCGNLCFPNEVQGLCPHCLRQMLVRLERETTDLRLKTVGKTALQAAPASQKTFVMKTSLLFLAGLVMVALALRPKTAAAATTEAWNNSFNWFTDDVEVAFSLARHLNLMAQVRKTNASTF